MPDTIESEAMNAAIQGTIFVDKLHIFPSVESTNTYAMQQGAKDAPHGSAYVAEEQTAGRGRGAHVWHSEPGTGLYVSVLLRPQMKPSDALWLSLASGLAVLRAVEDTTGMVADIRWPNDLLLGNRKFAGILTEMHAEATRVRYAVIGIGINVSHRRFPAELCNVATSLYLESKQPLSRQDLLAAILNALDAKIGALMQPESFAQTTVDILTSMEQKSSWVRGKHVFVNEGGGYTGVTAGQDSNGFLLVQTATEVRTVLSGGVRENSSASMGIE